MNECILRVGQMSVFLTARGRGFEDVETALIRYTSNTQNSLLNPNRACDIFNVKFKATLELGFD